MDTIRITSQSPTQILDVVDILLNNNYTLNKISYEKTIPIIFYAEFNHRLSELNNQLDKATNELNASVEANK